MSNELLSSFDGLITADLFFLSIIREIRRENWEIISLKIYSLSLSCSIRAVVQMQILACQVKGVQNHHDPSSKSRSRQRFRRQANVTHSDNYLGRNVSFLFTRRTSSRRNTDCFDWPLKFIMKTHVGCIEIDCGRPVPNLDWTPDLLEENLGPLVFQSTLIESLRFDRPEDIAPRRKES